MSCLAIITSTSLGTEILSIPKKSNGCELALIWLAEKCGRIEYRLVTYTTPNFVGIEVDVKPDNLLKILKFIN